MTELSFDEKKFEAVLIHIINRCSSKDNFGKTLLYKLLYFSDFNFYELHEKPITGETYYKLPHGPAPSHFEKVTNKLIEDKKIKRIRRVYKGKPQESFFPQIEPDLSRLSAEELKIIDDVISMLSSMNATQVSAYSHGDMPWRATGDNKPIDYELVFYRNEVYSVRDENDN